MTAVLTGDKHLNRMLSRLQGKEAKAAVRKAARPALKPVAAEAKRLAPKDSGRLKKSIKVRSMKRSRVRFGAMVRSVNNSDGTYYGGFQEWGWKAGLAKRQIEGKAFLRGATDRKRAQSLKIYSDEIEKNIVALAKKR